MDVGSLNSMLIGLAVQYGFQVLGALVILAAGALAGKWVARAVERALARHQFEPPIRKLSARVTFLLVLLLAAVMALDRFGFQIAPLVAGIGVAGLGVTIALQGVLSNVVAGLTIIFTKPFRVGQYIAIVGVHGEVSTIELFSTTLVHADQSRVIIPNRKIVGEILHNYGAVRQLHLEVSVPYGTDVGRAVAMASEVVRANPRVLRQPDPVVGVKTLGEAGITIAVDPWVGVPDFVPAGAEIYQALVERFRAERMELHSLRELRLIGAGAAA
jgi:small conductance mechanosensitive channel